MRYFYPTTVLLLAILLAGCASTSTPTAAAAPLASPTPDHSYISSNGIVSASANVVPAQTSRLGFLLSAAVQQVDVKEGDQVKGGQTLVVLDTPDLRLSVTAAKAAVREAQDEVDMLNYPYAKIRQHGKIIHVKAFLERRENAQAKLDAAQAALDAAQATLNEGTLIAPFDGTIVTVNVVPGQLIQPGQVAAVIGNLNDLQVETTNLSERQVAYVKAGQAATVHVRALDQDYSGRVIAIAPEAVQYNGDWVFKVTIALDQQPPGLTWGLSADVQIQTAK
ncbi:MAG TPA: efflux RND transporter periplasmic adaptor subunit [Anaerolineales bacterium]|nr:efflux RND transporter periplasmic adaptor subunit [Anaerolineales bacterium]